MRRRYGWRRGLLAVLAAVALVGGATGCTEPEDETRLGAIWPGTIVWIDGWSDDNEEGDKAEVEVQPTGMWTVPLNAHYRTNIERGFNVQVALTREGRWQIVGFNPKSRTRFGRDNDTGLDADQAYADMMLRPDQVLYEPTA